MFNGDEWIFGFWRRHRGFLAAWALEAAIVLSGCYCLRESSWIVLPVATLILAVMPGFNHWVYGAFPVCWRKTEKD